MPSIVRSILALVAGYVSMAVVVVALTVLIKRKAPEWIGSVGKPNPTYIYANLFYSFGAAMIGGFVTALLAPRAPLAHAWALAGIVFGLAVVSAVQSRNEQPRRYQNALAIIGPLGAVFGGMVQTFG